jgi:hypothetical protein
MTKCIACRERVKDAVRKRDCWFTPDLMNEIDLAFVKILEDEILAKSVIDMVKKNSTKTTD